jgi:hypothetical protein
VGNHSGGQSAGYVSSLVSSQAIGNDKEAKGHHLAILLEGAFQGEESVLVVLTLFAYMAALAYQEGKALLGYVCCLRGLYNWDFFLRSHYFAFAKGPL